MIPAAVCPPETVVPLDDPTSGLSGVIVLHSTRRGPAAGGCRLWRYSSAAAAAHDAIRLAEGMSLKNALADLPFGGGKAVLRLPEGPFDRKALFAAFGRVVRDLGGAYVTAEDVGTGVNDMQAVAGETHYVAGLPPRDGQPGGDPSPWTARGVYRAMERAVAYRLGKRLDEVTVAVQGVGHVGFALCDLLHRAGARLVIAEPRSALAAQAAVAFGAEVTSIQQIAAARVDVFAPCALGGVLDMPTVAAMRAKVVCGAANNQLLDSAIGVRLEERGILYAPDYLVNAGGIINVAAEHLGWPPGEVERRVDAIGDRLDAILRQAERDGTPPHAAADRCALALLAGRDRTVALPAAA